jgi:cytosine/adenosine deaminase-related metal-dependent hydrolase
MATENGARLLGFSGIGKIKPGWAADIAIFNVRKLQYAGSLSDPLAALVFAGIDHQTDYTIVNGRIVVAKGCITGYDEERLTEEANQISRELISNKSI